MSNLLVKCLLEKSIFFDVFVFLILKRRSSYLPFSYFTSEALGCQYFLNTLRSRSVIKNRFCDFKDLGHLPGARLSAKCPSLYLHSPSPPSRRPDLAVHTWLSDRAVGRIPHPSANPHWRRWHDAALLWQLEAVWHFHCGRIPKGGPSVTTAFQPNRFAF